MALQPSRRDFVCGIGILSVSGLAGCTANAPSSADTPRQYLYVRAINETDERRSLGISVVNDEELLFQQDLRLPAIQQKNFTDAETLVSLGKIPDGKRVTVKAVLDDDQTRSASAPLKLDCLPEDIPEDSQNKINANSISVIIQGDGSISVRNEIEENSNYCYRGTVLPSDEMRENSTETES